MDDGSSSEEDISAMLVSDPYYRKYIALKRRCQSVNQENQRLVSRVYQVQRLLRRARRQCRLVADRLDQHGDNYREAALRSTPEEPAADTPDQIPKARLKAEKKPKRRVNEPKKPSNPFFQYCQEQRGQMLSQMKGQNAGSLSKSGVTKQLAANWSQMSAQHKQKYVERYEHDKRQYAIAMQKLQTGGTLRSAEPP